MLFTILVAFSALFVAGCAAFFSIKGLITLFSGSAVAIGIMASSLEIGKLVAASFLHTHWRDIRMTLKTYLCLAVFVLMCITSLGIFGFLTNAYQTHANTVGTFETKIEALQSEKNILNEAIQESAARLKTLAELRLTQEQRIKDAGNYKAPREQAYKAIAEANDEMQLKEAAIAKSREKLTIVDKDIAELKMGMNTTTDIGSFKFIASALHTSVDESVRYFIFALIAVFDPLAVALVLCWNKLIEERAKKKKKENEEYVSDLKSLAATEPTPAPIPPAVQAAPITNQIIEQTQTIAAVPIKPIITKIRREKAPNKASTTTPVDVVSQLPIAEVPDKDSTTYPRKLTSEEENQELARRRKSAGANDSIITS